MTFMTEVMTNENDVIKTITSTWNIGILRLVVYGVT